MRFAIVLSRFNEVVTSGLLRGARTYLAEKGINEKDVRIFEAPGAFEIPLIAQKIAQSHRFDGVICLGCVIKGETAHFEFISMGATVGLIQASLNTGVPITFGILTAYNEEQALARSRDDLENKGREAAAACFESSAVIRTINPSAL